MTDIYHESPSVYAGAPVNIRDDVAELDRVLSHGQIRSMFQPIVELDTGLTVAYEALARGPASSPLENPGRLFAAARQCGRLSELDGTCQDAAMEAALRAGLTGSWRVFVNVEPAAARDALVTSDDVSSAQGGQPARLRVIAELTERSLTADPPQLMNLVARVRSRGWGIALDDVGADRNSLALLPFIRPDVIKLDLRLIQQRPSADIAEIFSAVNAEAERSGTTVLAEGIESRDHLNKARALGAALGQGWLFGRPGQPPKSAAPPAASTIRIIRRGPEASAESPFALLSAALPPRLVRKDLLIETSKHLEYQAMRSGEATAVLATFQEAGFFTPAIRRRYRQLAQCAAFVGVLGRGMPLAPAPGIRGGRLSPEDPVLSEWDIAVIGPHFASCLAARDLGGSGPDRQRRFEFVLSHNRELAIKAATALFSRIAREPARDAGKPLALPACPESVEDQPEHGLRSVFRPGCGPPEGAGELEEVAGVGVGADGAVEFARIEQLGDGGDDRAVGGLGDRPVGGGAERVAEAVLLAHGADQIGGPVPEGLQRRQRGQQSWHRAGELVDLELVDGHDERLGASSMRAWEFAKAMHLQRQHGWARFASMQDHYNLLAREGEREMIPLCLDEGVDAIIWSPLARGRLARQWEAAKSTARAETDGAYTDMLYSPLTADSDHAIIDAVGKIAAGRGVTRAQVALAWLRGARFSAHRPGPVEPARLQLPPLLRAGHRTWPQLPLANLPARRIGAS